MNCRLKAHQKVGLSHLGLLKNEGYRCLAASIKAKALSTNSSVARPCC